MASLSLLHVLQMVVRGGGGDVGGGWEGPGSNAEKHVKPEVGSSNPKEFDGSSPVGLTQQPLCITGKPNRSPRLKKEEKVRSPFVLAPGRATVVAADGGPLPSLSNIVWRESLHLEEIAPSPCLPFVAGIHMA